MKRITRIVVAAMLILTALAMPALAKGMTKEKATNAAQKLFKDFPFEVLSIKESKVKGLWEVALVLENRYRILYLDTEGRVAILPGPETQGHMVDLDRMASLTNEATSKLGRIEFKTLPLKDAIVLGNKDAKKQVAVFDDPY